MGMMRQYILGVRMADVDDKRGAPAQGLQGSPASTAMAPMTRAALELKLLDILRSELPDKNVSFTMDTPRDQVDIDSLAIIQTVFKVEEEFNVSIDLMSSAEYNTVGDFVNAVIACFPKGRIEN
jgi:acyl carrier protein